MGDAPLSTVTASALENWLHERYGDEETEVANPSTFNTGRKRCVALWNWARDGGLVPDTVKTQDLLTIYEVGADRNDVFPELLLIPLAWDQVSKQRNRNNPHDLGGAWRDAFSTPDFASRDETSTPTLCSLQDFLLSVYGCQVDRKTLAHHLKKLGLPVAKATAGRKPRNAGD